MALITQQINLYQVPQRYADRRLLVWLIMIMIITVIFFSAGIAHWKLVKLQTVLVNKQNQFEKLNVEMVQQMTRQSINEDVLPLIAVTGKKIEHYEKLTQLLDSVAQTHAGGYVAQLKLFSAKSSMGLRFLEIVVSEGGASMTLKGDATSAVLVGQYLNRLNDVPLLAAIKFNTFNFQGSVDAHSIETSLPVSTSRVSFTLSTDG